jgi:uncharacterized protein YjbI with pentapeptide repeats
MTNSVIKWGRSSQPVSGTVNYYNPITRNLVFLTNGFSDTNLVNNSLPTSKTGVYTKKHLFYSGINNNGSAVYNDYVVGTLGPSFTLLSFQVCASGSYQELLDSDDTGANRNFQFRINPSNQIELIGFSGTTATTATTSALTPTAPFLAIGVFNGTALSLYTDKTVKATATQGGNQNSSAFGFRVGYNKANVFPINGTIFLQAVWNRALTDNEVRSLSANPWQLFAPDYRNSYIYSPFAASSTVALSASGVGVASFTGQSLFNSTLSSAGAGLATLTGSSIFNSTLSSTGVGLGSFVGSSSSVGNATLTASGAGVGAFAGAALSTSTLSGSGIGVGSFIGASISTSTLSSSGLGFASLDGKSLFNSTLTAAGLASGNFVGASSSAGSAVLSAAGIGLGSFTGQSLAASTLSGTGVGLATLTGASLSNSTLSSAGIGLASFVSPTSSNSFSSSGLATVNFTGSALANSALSATGSSIASFGTPFTAIIASKNYTVYSKGRDYRIER